MNKSRISQASVGNLNYNTTDPKAGEQITIFTQLFLNGTSIKEISDHYRRSLKTVSRRILAGITQIFPTGRKNSHLTFAERRAIEFLHQIGNNPYQIAKLLGRGYNTVVRELKRTGENYDSLKAQDDYKAKVAKTKGPKKYGECKEFLTAFQKAFSSHKTSPYDFCERVKRGEEKGLSEKSRLCFKTIYNYIWLGLLEITPKDLPFARLHVKEVPVQEKRRGKKTHGRCIDERFPLPVGPDGEILEFGHWEMDTVIGKRGKDEPCYLVLVERKTRWYFLKKIPTHTADCVNEALLSFIFSFNGPFNEIFRSITTDNGTEFLDTINIGFLKDRLYYCHAGSPEEKAQVERRNGILRTFIPKSVSARLFSETDVEKIQEDINRKHCRCLDGDSPNERFSNELDRLSAAYFRRN